MRRIWKYLFIIISFFLLKGINVFAQTTYQAKLNANSVRFRTGTGINYAIIKELALGASYSIEDLNKYPDENGCEAGWYKLSINSQIGYVCSDYVDIIEINENTTGTAETECEIEMQNAGFPSSYWGKLCTLKKLHPTWNYKAIQTNLDWQSAVNAESACGLSYVQTSNEEYIDRSCKSAYSSASSWKPASQMAVAYYMDPRNFLTERYIFQFEYLRYDTNLASSYVNGAASILKNAQFYIYHSPNGIELGQVINQAGAETDVNPVFLSSRMLQELGNSNAEYDLYSGIYEGEEKTLYGYYNFFNYGVSDSCATTYGVAHCGLTFAKNNGWDSPLNAIKGAATSIASTYISVGQYTSYLQKFNVSPSNLNKLYLHQYMTNIAAPSSESSSAYNTYKKLSLLDSSFVFHIPIYNNMSANIININNGATGEVQNKDVEKTTLDINTIVTSSGFSYTSKYISKIAADTDVASIKSTIESVGGSGSVKITNAKDIEITSGKIGTGYKVIITNNFKSEILEAVVKGDTSGDGQVNALDLLQIRKNILEITQLSGAYNEAADISGDGKINALDLLQVRKMILGVK